MPDSVDAAGPVRSFLDRHFTHFNSRELVRAAAAYEAHVDAGGEMLVTLAGAMSTAEIGKILARMIRAGKVQAISCTGANLEEDLFQMLAGDEYEHVPDWRALSAADEQALLDRGMNRVTDTCIPETVMRELEGRLLELWAEAAEAGERLFPHEFMARVIERGGLVAKFQRDPADSWLLAALEADIPIVTPGWEDSTLGNIFTAAVMKGDIAGHGCVRGGTEALESLVRWYRERDAARPAGVPSVGFFQIGGGIAGDFPICAVPLILQDLREDVALWGYFCQISDATTSYGGYSGAVPNEKITWGKLAVETPKFMVQSDATIVAPLIFGWVLND